MTLQLCPKVFRIRLKSIKRALRHAAMYSGSEGVKHSVQTFKVLLTVYQSTVIAKSTVQHISVK